VTPAEVIEGLERAFEGVQRQRAALDEDLAARWKPGMSTTLEQMRLPDGSYPGVALLVAEASILSALAYLAGEPPPRARHPSARCQCGAWEFGPLDHDTVDDPAKRYVHTRTPGALCRPSLA
jgi:hypothetical protein